MPELGILAWLTWQNHEGQPTNTYGEFAWTSPDHRLGIYQPNVSSISLELAQFWHIMTCVKISFNFLYHLSVWFDIKFSAYIIKWIEHNQHPTSMFFFMISGTEWMDLKPPDKESCDGEGQEVSYETLVELLDSGDIQLIDVRDPVEFAEGSIPDAINVPCKSHHISSLAPLKCSCNIKLEIFIPISRIDILSIYCEIAFGWLPQDLSTLVKVMAWCH